MGLRMARMQQVTFSDVPITYAVVGADHLPVPAVLEFLQIQSRGAHVSLLAATGHPHTGEPDTTGEPEMATPPAEATR